MKYFKIFFIIIEILCLFASDTKSLIELRLCRMGRSRTTLNDCNFDWWKLIYTPAHGSKKLSTRRQESKMSRREPHFKSAKNIRKWFFFFFLSMWCNGVFRLHKKFLYLPQSARKPLPKRKRVDLFQITEKINITRIKIYNIIGSWKIEISTGRFVMIRSPQKSIWMVPY